MTYSTNTLIDRIAREFCNLLRSQLNTSEFNEMVWRHVNEGYVSSNACVSHEYCDANMVMAEAFEAVVGEIAKVVNEQHVALWSAAWDAAKANNFYHSI